MSADEFWRDDPQLFVSYRTSFINKKKREMEELDYKCWLQGLYNHDGNGKLFSSLKQFIGNIVASFSKSPKIDNSKIETYPKKPYSELLKEEERKKLEDKKKDNYKDYEESLVFFGTMKQRYLQEIERKQQERK